MAVDSKTRRSGSVKTSVLLAILCGVVMGLLSDPTAASALAIGEGNNSTGIAYEGSNHTLIFRWQTYGTSAWNREEAAGPDTTYSSPAIGETGSSTVIAYEGSHHTLIFRWQAYGSSTWNREEVAGPNTTYSAPSVGEAENANAIAAEGPDHSLDYYWQTYGTSQWNTEVVKRSNAAYSAPSLAEIDGVGCDFQCTKTEENDIYVEGPNHSLSDWNQTGSLGSSWYRYEPAGNDTTYSRPSAVDTTESGFDNEYDSEVAWEGANHTLQYYWSDVNPDYGGAGAEQVAGRGTTYTAPAIALGNNSTSITAEGDGGGVNFYWQTLGSSTWNPESVSNVGSTAWVSAQPAIAEGNNSTSITIIGPDHSLDFYWQTYGDAQWHPEYPGNGDDRTTYG